MFLKNKKFDVEHALIIYAHNRVLISISNIYEDHLMEHLKEEISQCHVYMIGLVPKINIISIYEKANNIFMKLGYLKKEFTLQYKLPQGKILHKLLNKEGKIVWMFKDKEGKLHTPTTDNGTPIDSYKLREDLSDKTGEIHFDVQYIGQALGTLESPRNALDRLKKHETLQKILIQGQQYGYELEALLLEVKTDNTLMTAFNPQAQNSDKSSKRISDGIKKLYGTNEAERITLFEASLIRYFKPTYNKIFKNNFPSTNMKTLNDCYHKDISMICAEINFDSVPYQFKSNSQLPQRTVMAMHNLHADEDRKVFFNN